MQETEEKVEEGWYLCFRNGRELEMYNDGDGKWHLSAYDAEDLIHRKPAKGPDKILKRISYSHEVILKRRSSWESN